MGVLTQPNQDDLPLPPHFDPVKVDQIWRVPYEEIAAAAEAWASRHHIAPAYTQEARIHLLLIDVQNTFCIPGYELFVRGRTGRGAVEDNERLCRFIYRNLARITGITATLDTHHATQIFHAIFLVNAKGQHPPPFSIISEDEIHRGDWNFNPALAASLGVSEADGDTLLAHYADQLKKTGKFELTVWPYHAMLGGIGHALVPSIEEALFFFTIARAAQPWMMIKGQSSFTEHYSAVGPEIKLGPSGEILGKKNDELIRVLEDSDALIIAGQAKSHCVSWTVSDLLDEIRIRDPAMAGKIYLLEDCTSPVVVPDAADFSEAADEAYQNFKAAGMHLVQSSTPMRDWPGPD